MCSRMRGELAVGLVGGTAARGERCKIAAAWVMVGVLLVELRARAAGVATSERRSTTRSLVRRS